MQVKFVPRLDGMFLEFDHGFCTVIDILVRVDRESGEVYLM